MSEYNELEAGFCLDRCQRRIMYKNHAEIPAQFSADDCADIIRDAGSEMNNIQGKCGIAALAVAMAAGRGKFQWR